MTRKINKVKYFKNGIRSKPIKYYSVITNRYKF